MAGPDLLTLYERKNALAKAGLNFDLSYQYSTYQKSQHLPIVYEPGLYERAESLARAGIIGEFSLRNLPISSCSSLTSLPLLFLGPLDDKTLLHRHASFSSLDCEAETLAGTDYTHENIPLGFDAFEEFTLNVPSDTNQAVGQYFVMSKTYQDVYCLDSDALILMMFVSLCLGLLFGDYKLEIELSRRIGSNIYWQGALMYATGTGLSVGSLMIAWGAFSEFNLTSPSDESRWRLLLASSVMTVFSVTSGIISLCGLCGTFSHGCLASCAP